MDNFSIYGSHLPEMHKVMEEMLRRIDQYRDHMKNETGTDPVDHTLSRIKSEESMREKCRRRGFPETTESALSEIHDAIGIRIVCPFVNDVYSVIGYLHSFSDCRVVEEKDYIRHAKPNGYRSYHIILHVRESYFVEVQLRTVSMDTWAALEHQLKYKKEVQNQNLIEQELKRCADELASTDASMQTIRDMIREEAGNMDMSEGYQ